MPTYKSKQSGSYIAGVTKVKLPSPDIVISRNEANSGMVTTSTKGTSTWTELRQRVTQFEGYNVGGGVNTSSDSTAAIITGGDYWLALSMAFSEFDLSPLIGISSVDISSVKLRYTLTSNSVNASRVKTFSVFTDSYTTLSSSTWRIVESGTTALGTVAIDTPTSLTRDVTINKSLLTGSHFRIVTIHDLLRETNPSPSAGGVTANIAEGSPKLIVSGNFGDNFIPVNIGVL